MGSIEKTAKKKNSPCKKKFWLSYDLTREIDSAPISKLIIRV